jgi:hypothetical protein
MQNPELARDILYKLSLRDVLKCGVEDANISKPTNPIHLVSIKFNTETGKFEVCFFVFFLSLERDLIFHIQLSFIGSPFFNCQTLGRKRLNS